MKKILICIGLTLMLSACGYDHAIRFNLSHQQIMEDEKASIEARSHFFLWGIGQETDYDLSAKCRGRGIKAIEAHWSFWDSFWNGMTMGIYAPESFLVWCN